MKLHNNKPEPILNGFIFKDKDIAELNNYLKELGMTLTIIESNLEYNFIENWAFDDYD